MKIVSIVDAGFLGALAGLLVSLSLCWSDQPNAGHLGGM